VRDRRGRRLTRSSNAPSWLALRWLGIAGAIAGLLAVRFFAPSWLHGTTRWVAAYDVAAIVLLAYDWTFGLRNNATHTIRRAAEADPGRNLLAGIVLVSVIAGLASAVSILGRGPDVPASDHSIAVAVGIAAVALGWFLIHTMYTFRYAHLYYYDSDQDGSAQRGLTFPGTADPDDYDFAYFAFVVGMTFQVSDVQITDPGVRSVVLLHGILSFGYNTAILALVVNLASNLLNTH